MAGHDRFVIPADFVFALDDANDRIEIGDAVERQRGDAVAFPGAHGNPVMTDNGEILWHIEPQQPLGCVTNADRHNVIAANHGIDWPALQQHDRFLVARIVGVVALSVSLE
jgi:hypothetical protein